MNRSAYIAVAVTVTPFLEGCRPDLEEIGRQTALLGQSASDAIFPCSSTGEFVRMSREDRFAVLETVARHNTGKKLLFAGAADASTDGVKATLRAAAAYGYDACVVNPPYYYGLPQEDVLQFYREVCACAGSLPVIAYHVPFFTTGIEQDTFLRLLELPNLTGMKDSSANLKRISHLCDLARERRPDFRIYTGTDDCLLPALSAGCRGSMTALGASLPRYVAAVYDAFCAGDLPGAMAAQRAMLPILRLADSLPFPLGYKVLAKAVGLRTEELEPRCQPVYEKLRALLD